MDLVTCPKCGQVQAMSEEGNCIKCGCKIEFSEPQISLEDECGREDGGSTPPKQKSTLKTLLWAFVIICIVMFLGKMIGGAGDGSKCYVCGKDSIYTTSSGYGVCGQHLIEGLSYEDD